MSFAYNITFSNDDPSLLTTIALITHISLCSLIFSKPMLYNQVFGLFFGNCYVLSAGNMTSMNVQLPSILIDDMVDLLIEPIPFPSLDPTDVTTTRICILHNLSRLLVMIFTYKGDGCNSVYCLLLYNSSKLPLDLYGVASFPIDDQILCTALSLFFGNPYIIHDSFLVILLNLHQKTLVVLPWLSCLYQYKQ